MRVSAVPKSCKTHANKAQCGGSVQSPIHLLAGTARQAQAYLHAAAALPYIPVPLVPQHYHQPPSQCPRPDRLRPQHAIEAPAPRPTRDNTFLTSQIQRGPREELASRRDRNTRPTTPVPCAQRDSLAHTTCAPICVHILTSVHLYAPSATRLLLANTIARDTRAFILAKRSLSVRET